jgi:hypothetical protein
LVGHRPSASWPEAASVRLAWTAPHNSQPNPRRRLKPARVAGGSERHDRKGLVSPDDQPEHRPHVPLGRKPRVGSRPGLAGVKGGPLLEDGTLSGPGGGTCSLRIGRKRGRGEAARRPPRPSEDRTPTSLRNASGEVCQMTTGSINRSEDVWTFTPATHKTQHHGDERAIYIGAQGQAILRAFLRAEPDAPLFSPAETTGDAEASLASSSIETPADPQTAELVSLIERDPANLSSQSITATPSSPLRYSRHAVAASLGVVRAVRLARRLDERVETRLGQKSAELAVTRMLRRLQIVGRNEQVLLPLPLPSPHPRLLFPHALPRLTRRARERFS